MKIVYILPSRQRVTAFFDTLNNIIENSVKDAYEIIVTLDEDDTAMNNDAVKKMIAKYEKVTAYWGYSKNKVDAINKNVGKIPKDADIVILMSDDQKFIVEGFDDIIRVDAQKYFKDLDFCLHYDDGTPSSNILITMNIFGIAFYKRFNYLYHPDYANVYADNEVTEVAKRLGKYKFVPNHKIYKHMHPVWGTAPNDDLYKRNEEPVSYAKDKETYFKHLANNFGL